MQQSPILTKGTFYTDERGEIRYNNHFDASVVKRLYLIQNSAATPLRGWQGHRIEQRWFIPTNGIFKIFTIAVDNWEHPSPTLQPKSFLLTQNEFSVLHVPAGHITAIQSIETGSTLLAMSNYLLGTIKDEYRFPIHYFNHTF